MHLSLVAAGAFTAALLVAGTASAEPNVGAPTNDTIFMHDKNRSAAPPAPGAAPVNTSGGGGITPVDLPPMVAIPAINWSPATGAPCANYTYVPAGDPRAANVNQAFASGFPTCPGSAPAPQPTAADAAVYAWQNLVRLPKPAPEIDPGWGIVGKLAYLEIGGARSPGPLTYDVFGYQLTISASTTHYDVEWGDGATSTGVTTNGGPWPTGDVTHPFQNAKPQPDAYPVRVVQHWTASWSASNGQSGTITSPLFTDSTLPFPVVELQAIRTR